jgi:predicted HicB family RNase H-like nuclease
MPPKKKTPETITFRIDGKDREALGKEARAVGLGITAYVRHLVYTHQDRPHNKKK